MFKVFNMFKVLNKVLNMFKILTINFIVNFEHISQLVPVFLFLYFDTTIIKLFVVKKI